MTSDCQEPTGTPENRFIGQSIGVHGYTQKVGMKIATSNPWLTAPLTFSADDFTIAIHGDPSSVTGTMFVQVLDASKAVLHTSNSRDVASSTDFVSYCFPFQDTITTTIDYSIVLCQSNPTNDDANGCKLQSFTTEGITGNKTILIGTVSNATLGESNYICKGACSGSASTTFYPPPPAYITL